MIGDDKEMRFQIFKLLVESREPMGLSAMAKRLHVPQQKIAYHLPILEHAGLVIRDETTYFCQPVFLDKDLLNFCAQKLSEIVKRFSTNDNEIIVGEEMMEKEEVVLNCLYALITLTLSPNGE